MHLDIAFHCLNALSNEMSEMMQEVKTATALKHAGEEENGSLDGYLRVVWQMDRRMKSRR